MKATITQNSENEPVCTQVQLIHLQHNPSTQAQGKSSEKVVDDYKSQRTRTFTAIDYLLTKSGYTK